MKRGLIITINLLIMGFILFIITSYANTKAEESYENGIRSPRDPKKALIAEYYKKTITDIFF